MNLVIQQMHALTNWFISNQRHQNALDDMDQIARNRRQQAARAKAQNTRQADQVRTAEAERQATRATVASRREAQAVNDWRAQTSQRRDY